jgi:predicted dehydrogenase
MRHPLVLDMAIHHADLLRAVTGRDVASVFARGWQVPDSPYEHDPAVVAVLALEGGATVTYRGDWATHEPETSWNGAWAFVGARGRLVWRGGESDPLSGEVLLERLGEASAALALPELAVVDRAGSLAAFREAVETGREPETNARDNVGSLAVVLAMVESIERGEVVEVGRT